MARLWIARDYDPWHNGRRPIFAFWSKPTLDEEFKVFQPSVESEDFMRLPSDMFPDLTYEGSPREVELTLIDHKDG